MIATLTKDNEVLKREVKLAEAENGAMLQSKETITNLQLQYEGYTSEIKQEQARVAQLDREDAKIRKELQKARETKAKAERESNDVVSSQKLIARLENRVQKATNDYDDQLVRELFLTLTLLTVCCGSLARRCRRSESPLSVVANLPVLTVS